jgi:shikimate dehydrogenase
LDQINKPSKRIFGLIGKALSHSFSPAYFHQKFKHEHINDAEYKLFPLESIEEIKSLFASKICGLNVTIPYKQSVIPFLDELDPSAAEINAVNTIVFKNGKIKGFNTDVYGFKKSLANFIQIGEVLKALILGTGGASLAVQFVLKELNIEYLVVSRNKGNINYAAIDEKTMLNHKIIVNCTPLGMVPKDNKCPDIPYEFLSDKHYLFDLIYNPEKSLFLKKGEEKTSNIKNGFEMLCHQADRSWELWNHE